MKKTKKIIIECDDILDVADIKKCYQCIIIIEINILY